MKLPLQNEPRKTDPKPSEMTALNLWRLVAHQLAPIAH
jgi:hypothetical protein